MRCFLIVVLLFIADASALHAQIQFPQLRHRRSLQSHLVPARAMQVLGLPDSTATSLFPNINVTNDPLDDQDEPSISVNPANPLAIDIGGVDDRNFNVLWNYASTNGGLSWKNAALPIAIFDGGTQQFSEATDPGVVFDESGTLFFSNVFENDPGLFDPNEEACYVSHDDGQLWNDPVYAGGDTNSNVTTSVADRDYIAADRDSGSTFFGNVYITWVTIAYPKSIIVESRSTDHGGSWSLPVTVSSAPVTQDTVLFQGPVPACGPDGELYITYEDRDSLSKRILVARSLDGGVSFDSQVEVSPYRELGPVVPDNFNGHPTVKDSVETNSFPMGAIS